MTETVEEEIFRDIVRNISKLIILWSINNKTQSGYSVKKEMERILNQKFYPGVVYPLLYTLEEEGFIIGEWVQKGRRRIKYYSITEKGKDLLNRMGRLVELPLKDFLSQFLSK